MPAPSIFSADWRNELLKWLTAAFQPLSAALTSWAGVTRASGFDTFAATPSSANLRALLTDETGTGAAYFQGGALGTPASGTLTNCTGLPNSGVVGLGTAALKNTGTSGNNVPLLDGLNSFSTTQTIDISTATTFSSGLFVRKRGTTGDATAAVTAFTEIGYHSFYGWNGTTYVRCAYAIANASEAFTGTANGGFYRIVTVTPGTTTEVTRLTIGPGVQVGAPTGGDKGADTLNVPTLYINGVVVSPPGAPVAKTADFTVAAAENNLINNKSGATCTVTLPAASSFAGREILINNIQAQTVVSASSNVVPKAGGAAGTAILPATAGAWAKLVSDGTNWKIMMSGT